VIAIPPPSLLLLALALAPATQPLQSWEPFRDRREVSPSGRHYAVLRASKDPPGVRFELCRRREGAPPLSPAAADPVAAAGKGGAPDFARDPEDALLATGLLPQPPFQVRVLDREPALVLFEKYGALGQGDALALLGADGKARWSLRLGDLFKSEAVEKFPRDGADVWWFEAWWVDEERGAVVLCPVEAAPGEVALADGKVRGAEPAAVLARAAAGPLPERLAALEVAARVLPEGVEGTAARLLAAKEEPLAVRIRAAVCLRRKTGGGGDAGLVRASLAPGAPPEARAFAARVAAELLGEAAIPLLREVLRGEADETWRPAMAALAELGEKAVPVLVEMLGEKGQSLDYRGAAAHVLGGLKAESALPALWKAAEAFDPEADEFHFVPGAALDAAIAVGPADLRERLLALLAKGTPHDGRIAQWLARNPGRDAVPHLEKALARWGEYDWARKRLAEALEACRK
jgi:hypothetical protein